MPEEFTKESKHRLFHLAVFWGMTLCIVTSVGTNVSKGITSALNFALMKEALYSTKLSFSTSGL